MVFNIKKPEIAGAIAGGLTSLILVMFMTGPHFGPSDAYWTCFHSSTPLEVVVIAGIAIGFVSTYILTRVLK